MTKETYIKMTQPFRDNPGMAKGIHIANSFLTGIMYVSYPLLLLYLFWRGESNVWTVILVPAISFIILSVGRALINRPRPYEAFGIPPVIKKDTKGKSFPSRHVFSATLIAMTFLWMSPWMWLGVLYLVISVCLGVVRVLSGIHYISDVVAGIVIGVLAPFIGYIIL